MTNNMFRRIGLVLLGMIISLQSGEPELPTVEEIVSNVTTQFQKVKDYSATVELKVEMPKVRMPSKKLRFYYKQPDKIKIETDGFAIVPKTGLGGSAVELLTEMDSTRVLRQEERGARLYWVMSGNINQDSLPSGSWRGSGSDMGMDVTITMWIDSERWVIGHSETQIDSLDAISVSSVYAEYDEGIFLPMVTEILIHTSALRGMTHRRPSEGPFGDRQDFTEGRTDAQGSVRMEFHKYKINTGLDDKLFNE